MQDDLTLSDGAVRIPLRARNGTVRAYAIVDAADAEWANQWRWHLHAGYARRTQRLPGSHATRERRWIHLHRELLDLNHGDPRQSDHIDRDKLNNRRRNLRVVPRGGNQQNVGAHRGAYSRYRGVTWSKADRRWQAQVRAKGKTVFIGLYASEFEAARAAQEARLRLLPYTAEQPLLQSDSLAARIPGPRSFRGSSSRFPGVAWHKHRNKWVAWDYYDGCPHYVGIFAVEEDAAAAALRARERRLAETQQRERAKFGKTARPALT